MPNSFRLVAALLLAGCTANPPSPVHYQEALAAKNSVTRSTQIQLIRLGYLHTANYGLYDDKTRNAISNFEEANGLMIDGTPSVLLLATLTSSTAVVSVPVVLAPVLR